MAIYINPKLFLLMTALSQLVGTETNFHYRAKENHQTKNMEELSNSHKTYIILQRRSIASPSNDSGESINHTAEYKEDIDRRMHKKNIVFEIIQFIVSPLLFVTGVIGNVLVILAIVKQQTLQNLQNYFVFNLAVTDLIVLILLMPLHLTSKYVSWPFGLFTCKYILPVSEVVPTVSILTLVAISIDRYRVIIHALAIPPPLKFGVIVICSFWVLCYLVVAFPLTLIFNIRSGYWMSKMCIPKWNNFPLQITYYTGRTIFFYVVPSVIIYFCYVRVNYVLVKNMSFLARSVSGIVQVARIRAQKRIMAMFFAIFLTFVLCYLPTSLITFVIVFIPAFRNWSHAGDIFKLTTTFAFANSVCNPIILYKLSRAYRESFRKYLPTFICCCKTESVCKLSNRRSSEMLEDDQTANSNTFLSILFIRRRSTKDSNVSLITDSPISINDRRKQQCNIILNDVEED